MISTSETIWVLLAAALLFFMQAGFTMVEVGFTRLKNTSNIILKNLLNISVGTIIFWFLGFGLMYASNRGVIGVIDFFIKGNYEKILPEGITLWPFVMFQTGLCTLCITIASGALSERMKFSAYCVNSIVIASCIVPVIGHWIWGGGWLAQLGFHDFAGATVINMSAGVAALVGAKMLGPRKGKYTENGEVKAIPGQSITISSLGVFVIWFCWFAWSSGIWGNLDEIGLIFMNTNISATVSVVTTLVFTSKKYKKPDLSMALNGAMAGLVVITSGCDIITPEVAAFMGFLAGAAVVLMVEYVDRTLKIDDPTGVISVYGFCGALGSILTGLFASDKGLFGGGGSGFFLIQCLGVLAVILWTAAISFIFYKIVDQAVGLRVTSREEMEGLNTTEHGLPNAFSEVLPTISQQGNWEEEETQQVPKEISIDEAVPIKTKRNHTIASFGNVLTKVDIICNQAKFDALKKAMNEIGVSGMTVTQVFGCGIQKGAAEYYRGTPVDVQLLPKMRIEMVLAKVPVQDVVNVARKILYTGHIGDGKIFIYDVRDAVKIRTGETGYDAMQGIDVLE